MSTIPAKSQYLLLLRNTELEKRLSLDEMEEAMRRFNEIVDLFRRDAFVKHPRRRLMNQDGHVLGLLHQGQFRR